MEVLFALFLILIVCYVFLTLYSAFVVKNSQTNLATVFRDFGLVCKKALRNPDWLGDNLYEKMVHSFIGVPLIFITLIGIAYLIQFLKKL